MREGQRQHHGTFASLVLVPNYRLVFGGALLSNTGGWAARVAQDWLVLTELTDRSAAVLGLLTTLQLMWVPLLAPWAGVVADRFPKRRVLLVTQSVMTCAAFALATLVVTGRVQLWHVFVTSAVHGLAMAFDGPARMSFASEVVPPHLLSNAVSLNSAQFNSARLIGPAAGGVLTAAFGVGVCLMLNAVSFLAVIGSLLLLDTSRLSPAPPRRGKGAVREAFGYLRGRPDLVLVMGMVAMLAVFAAFQVTTALAATTVFGKGATEFGILGSVLGVGSLAGALLNARRDRPRLGVLLAAVAGQSVVLALLAVAPSYEVFAVLLLPAGLTMLTVLTTANTTIQTTTDPSLRGRVLALYMAVSVGSMPLGALLAGFVSDRLGVRWMLGLGAVMIALTFVVAAVVLVRWAGGWDAVRGRGERRRPAQPTREG